MPLDAPTAFFSYSRNDSEFTLRLAEDLKAAGAHVWLDQLDIEPGQRWARAIQDALNNSSRVLVILSPSSVNSTNVEDEITFALEEHKAVIPVLYRDCRVPFQLRPFQYVDFRTDYARGLKVMLKTLGVKQQAAPTAAAPSAASKESPPVAPDIADSEIAKNKVLLEKQAVEPAWVEREHRQATEQAHLQEEDRRAAEQTRLEQERKQAETRLALERQEAAEHDAKPAQIKQERVADDGTELEREVVAEPLVEPGSKVQEHDETTLKPTFQKSRLKIWLLFVLFGAVLTTSLWYSARHPSITKGGSAEEHYDRGYRFWEKGDLTRAALEYREAIRLAPNDFFAHSNLAVILGEKGDVDGSIAEYREAIRLMPDDRYGYGDMHHFNLGNMLRKKGDTAAAIIEYRKAITLSPDDAYAHDNLGVMLAEKGDIEGAIAEFREASRLNANQDYNLKMALQYKNGDSRSLPYRLVPSFTILWRPGAIIQTIGN